MGRAKHKRSMLRKLVSKYKRKALGFWKRLQRRARKFKTKKRGKKKGKKTGKKEGKKATSPIVRKLNTSVKKVMAESNKLKNSIYRKALDKQDQKNKMFTKTLH